MPRRRALATIVVVMIWVTGCSRSGDPTATTSATNPPATTSTPTITASPTTSPTITTAPTTTTLPSTTTEPPSSEIVLELPTVSQMDESWTQVAFIPYGEAEAELGTSSGGEGLNLGPDYGTQAADGTWWFLDKAKNRFAHYSAAGEYIDAVGFDPRFLVNGQFFQFQLLRAMADGALMASKLGTDSGSTLFRMEGTDGRIVDVPTFFAAKGDDGTTLFGFDRSNGLLAVDPQSGEATPVEWFATQAGNRYRIRATGDAMTVELPDATPPAVRTLRLVYAGDTSIPAFAGIEVATGVDGSLYILLYGGTDSGVGDQLGGFLTVSPDGEVSALETIRDPFSPSDPGSPGHLGVRPGSSAPWLMFIDTDGVRLFAKE